MAQLLQLLVAMKKIQDPWALGTIVGVGTLGLTALGAVLSYVVLARGRPPLPEPREFLVEPSAKGSGEPEAGAVAARGLPSALPSDLAQYGKRLVEETFRFLGPEAPDESLRFAGNQLACKNCHLDAGTKPFSGSYVGVTKRYPAFRGRENRIGTIEDRVNGCMERSMNGRPLPVDGREMKAFVAYMTQLSEATTDGKVKGRGFLEVDIPDRAVDLARGKDVFYQSCATCHGQNGLGRKRGDGLGYEYPPVAGPDSYNTGAGMHRVLTATAFIYGNMPLGATAEQRFLSQADAFDVAGYINSLDRPEKGGTEGDFPDRKLKPLSTPYPPYADDFPQEQHKYGPFAPMRDFYVAEYGLEKSQ